MGSGPCSMDGCRVGIDARNADSSINEIPATRGGSGSSGIAFLVAIAIAAVYFGLGPHTWIQGASFFGVMAILMIATVPQRLGFVVALNYLSRRYWPDPDDPIPPTFSSDRTELSETFRPASASPRTT